MLCCASFECARVFILEFYMPPVSVCVRKRERDTTAMCELCCKYKQRFFETVINRDVIVFFIEFLPICISPQHLVVLDG